MKKHANALESTKREGNTERNKNEQHFFKDFTTFPPAVLKWVESNSTIVIWDLSGQIVYSSQNVTDLLGYSPDDLIGKKWYDNVSKKDAVFLKRHTNAYAVFHQTLTLAVINKEGKYVWCECSIKKMEENNGETHFVAVLNDISDKKEAEEMLVRSEKMSVAGQLAAGIAHEIRNPLTSIKGFLQLLQAGISHKEQYYKIMIDEIEKIESISSELLFISKPMSDTMEMAHIEKMIEEVVLLLRPEASLNGCTIAWNTDSDHEVYCDRSQIKQVLINLIKNAYEAMNEGGAIELKVLEDDSNIIINIIDEGPGVPEKLIHKLDEPFFTTKQNGTGLGLMITSQILEKHDGQLQIFHNENIGSTFRIILPKHK